MDYFKPIVAALADLRGLTLFTCRDKPLMKTFRTLLACLSREKPPVDEKGSALDLVEEWSSFLRSLVQTEPLHSFYQAVAFLTLTDDNPFTHTAESQKALPPLLAAVAKTDLSRLGRLAGFDLPGLGFHIAERLRQAGLNQLAGNIEEEARALWVAEGKQPVSQEAQTLLNIFPEAQDWGLSLTEFTAYLHAKGAGELGLYKSFRWVDNRRLKPVFNPDEIKLADLAGYEEPRQVVIENTRRFLEGRSANNLLLYGDRGTGKSATVKAVCNEYAHRGLRLLEVSKRDLFQFPLILDAVGSRALRFIIFIDDLSFETTDDSFTSLKMLLEGGVEAKPSNVVVYATSNRRHLVKERLADRPTTALAADAAATGDMRAFDTMQEQFSLADRFGLTVVFTAPGQEDFLRIAEHIAIQRGILQTSENPDERKPFRDNALRWERWFNGRSPRTAVQYVDWVAGGAGFPWE